MIMTWVGLTTSLLVKVIDLRTVVIFPFGSNVMASTVVSPGSSTSFSSTPVVQPQPGFTDLIFSVLRPLLRKVMSVATFSLSLIFPKLYSLAIDSFCAAAIPAARTRNMIRVRRMIPLELVVQ